MDLLTELSNATNSEKAQQMEKYMRDQFPFFGIPAPERKKIFQAYMKTIDSITIDWDFVEGCWKKEQREWQYIAIDYLIRLKKQLIISDIPRLKQLITTKSWWDTVDGLDELLGYLALQNPEVEKLMLDWSQDENIWVRRVAINHQLLRKNQTNTILLKQILCNNLNDTEFFINKAIGWSLRDYSKTNPEWVRQFIQTHKEHMAPLSIREASKYI
ncbi:MAG TPA: DNA alkylation repair protein [Candidatus Enterococcus avicola]|uniref:DNA alkylation repair protein n=1 Tax=Candidatus Enterococcus avicola TaxID=2838561 RepID=A0A9D2JH18_9ENTE|nr:DNA alkylation repair protein [Candidatus Enterococcus avicola]